MLFGQDDSSAGYNFSLVLTSENACLYINDGSAVTEVLFGQDDSSAGYNFSLVLTSENACLYINDASAVTEHAIRTR